MLLLLKSVLAKVPNCQVHKTVPLHASPPPQTPHSQGLIGEVWGAGGLHVVEMAVQDVKTIEAHLSTCNGDKAIPERAVGGGCGAIVAAHLWSGTHQWQQHTMTDNQEL